MSAHHFIPFILILSFAVALTALSCGDSPATPDLRPVESLSTPVPTQEPVTRSEQQAPPTPAPATRTPVPAPATPSTPSAATQPTPGTTTSAAVPTSRPATTPLPPAPTPIPKPAGYHHGLEHGFALVQNDRRPSPDRQGWVDITLDLAVTRFGPEEVSASRISYLVDGDSVCFENSGPPNDCISVVWGSSQQFTAAFDEPTRPTTLDVPSGSAVLLSLTFEVAENAASASLVAGETTVPIDLLATAEAVGALDEPLPAPTPPPGSSNSANTAGYFMDGSYGIAVTGVSREPDTTSPTLSVATVELSLLSLHEPDGLAPGIRRTATPGTACFVSDPEDECIRVRWGDELQYQAMLSLSPDGVESWPRGMGWQGNVSFPLPVGVTGATLSFGEHRIPIDLRGMTGGAPTYDYTAHYPEFAVTPGSQLYDSGGMTITFEGLRHDADSGDMALYSALPTTPRPSTSIPGSS